jgi:predicted DCC family thiol-disulfide oxidoreductase YuxK
MGQSPRFLVLLFDESCPLCRRLRSILSKRRPTVPIYLVAVGSPRAAELFPVLDLRRAREILTVVDDSGRLYEGDAAWIVCAWALPALRGFAEHVSTGWRRRIVRSGADALNAIRLIGRDPYPESSGKDVEAAVECADSCPVGLPSCLASNDVGPGRIARDRRTV